jgi:hypothetical protein
MRRLYLRNEVSLRFCQIKLILALFKSRTGKKPGFSHNSPFQPHYNLECFEV